VVLRKAARNAIITSIDTNITSELAGSGTPVAWLLRANAGNTPLHDGQVASHGPSLPVDASTVPLIEGEDRYHPTRAVSGKVSSSQYACPAVSDGWEAENPVTNAGEFGMVIAIVSIAVPGTPALSRHSSTFS
jgi:hypothetical protein